MQLHLISAVENARAHLAYALGNLDVHNVLEVKVGLRSCLCELQSAREDFSLSEEDRFIVLAIFAVAAEMLARVEVWELDERGSLN